MKWYVVYTKPRWEKKVAEALSLRGIENYCPLNRVVRQWSDRKKLVLEPLFPSYVFVRVAENQFNELKKVNGILNLVYWQGKPAPIKDTELEVIKQFLGEHINVKLEQSIHINDSITISKGSLTARQGTVIAIKNKTVKVALPTIGYVMYAEVEKSSIVRTTDTFMGLANNS